MSSSGSYEHGSSPMGGVWGGSSRMVEAGHRGKVRCYSEVTSMPAILTVWLFIKVFAVSFGVRVGTSELSTAPVCFLKPRQSKHDWLSSVPLPGPQCSATVDFPT